jgi:hypothetical protein
LRKVVLERAGKTIGDAHLVARQAATIFHQLLQFAHRGALRLQGFEPFPMFAQQVELQTGIGGVVFGAAAAEHGAVTGQRLRVDRKQHEEVVFAERIDEGPFVEFQAHGDRLALEAALQIECPGFDGLWAMRDDGGFGNVGVGAEQADVVFGIGPVDADEGGEPIVDRIIHFLSPKVYRCQGTCELGLCEGIIGSRCDGIP